VSTIAEWLTPLGLSEYTDCFVENGIDVSVLPDLTDQDLKDLGVLLGHRRKILRAIRDLGDSPVAATAPTAPVATEPTRRDDAERRQLTVTFTDLVGSTALSARLDPEDLRSVIGAYHKCVAETVARFDGFVAKYMGDGVLIYFGYPHAHEDDAERAVRAGLALIEAVGRRHVQEPLQVRIGVATGLVVVGDIVGSGEAQERGVVGETPNLAARLQGTAAPNTVVIAEGTRRLLGNLFELADLGPKDLKGIVEPARAWVVLRARSIESRFEGLHVTGLTTLVGRQEEPSCCSGAGRGQRPAKVRWCCSLARPASANLVSRLRLWTTSRASRTLACAISVPRSTPIARCIRSSARWNGRPDWRTTTALKPSSTSSGLSSLRPRPRSRTPHFLPRCSRSPMMAAILSST
jgi:class 3 adenylate cyclase